MGCMMASARCRGLLLACLLLACLLLAPFAAEAQQVKLRLTSQLPSSHYAGINLAQFKEEVERRSEKTLIIEIFDDGRLYKDDGAMGAVSSGAVDMGFVTGDRFAEKIAAVSIFQQPFLFNFEALVRAAISPDHEIRRLIDKAILESTGTRVLWWLPFGSTVILSKGRPAISPAEISKQKIRVQGPSMAAFVERCGGIPALVNAGDMLAAMQDGRVDHDHDRGRIRPGASPLEGDGYHYADRSRGNRDDGRHQRGGMATAERRPQDHHHGGRPARSSKSCGMRSPSWRMMATALRASTA